MTTMAFFKSISIGIFVVSCSSISAAVVHVPPVVKNLARGSFLKCAADLTGGLVSEMMLMFCLFALYMHDKLYSNISCLGSFLSYQLLNMKTNLDSFYLINY